MNEPDLSLWELLGLSGPPEPEPVPESVWETAVAAAVDPAAALVDRSLIPEPEDETIDLGDEIDVSGTDTELLETGEDPFETFTSGQESDVFEADGGAAPDSDPFAGDIW